MKVSHHQNQAALLVPIVLCGREARKVIVSRTISQALHIGEQLTIESLCNITQGILQFEGQILEWNPQLREGFLWGFLIIQDQTSAPFNPSLT